MVSALTRWVLLAAASVLVTGRGLPASANDMAQHTVSRSNPSRWSNLSRPIADVPVRDQNNRPLRFYSDLVKGRVVVIDFVFTGCTTLCPGLSTTFRTLQDLPGGKDVSLISISVDPANDGPAELKAYAAKFDAQPGWTLVTGRPDQIARLVTSLGVAAGAGADHAALFVVHDAAGEKSTIVPGSASAAELMSVIQEATARQRTDAAASQRYFTNLMLQTQDGRTVRFFDDLLRNRVAVIEFIYTRCPDICSPATQNLALVQSRLEKRYGKAVQLISISVDPEHDTPEELARYARDHGAGPGWTFLTALPGKRENLDWVAHRLGGYSPEPAMHGTMVVIGDEATGTWVKLPAMSAPDVLLKAIERLAGRYAEAS